jgi:hypothetical protein
MSKTLKGESAAMLTPAVLQLLGPEYGEPARRAAVRMRARAHLLPGWRDGWYHHLLGYNAGLLKSADLLEKAGASRFNQCEAHFYIGLKALAAGDRAGAKQAFARSAGTGVFPYIEYMWSRAFLAWVDDPDWLAGLPAHRPAPARFAGGRPLPGPLPGGTASRRAP